jgi:MurNAc alpha-1-phosphate uridylyltransferase
MQAVILAGGLGTRLGSLTGGLPKPMVDICGKPFLEYELELLRDHGVTSVVLCVGYLGHKIQEYFTDGAALGLDIEYSFEDEGHLMGTAGAVKQAEHLLEERFFLTYADSYMPMDYGAAFESLGCRGEQAMMVVMRNDNGTEASNLLVEGGKVTVYDKSLQTPGMHYINFGVSVLRKEALALVPEGKAYSQEDWYQDLIRGGNLAAFETQDRYYEIGSPEGLAQFRALVASGALS